MLVQVLSTNYCSFATKMSRSICYHLQNIHVYACMPFKTMPLTVNESDVDKHLENILGTGNQLPGAFVAERRLLHLYE